MGADLRADGWLGGRAEKMAHLIATVKGAAQSDLGGAGQGPRSAVIHGADGADEFRAWLTLGGGSWNAVGSKILGGR